MKTKNNIDANTFTIEKFLNDSIRISIPRYQREYSWEKKNIITLLHDVDEGYYIGNIISFSNDYGCREIIDGQQRLITTFLILIAIMHLTDNSDLVKKVKKLIINNNKCKLFLDERIGDDGNNLLNHLIESDERMYDSIKKYNEVSSYKFIKNELKKIKDINVFYRRLVRACLVDVCFTEKEAQAHEMFVNVNTKGKPLRKIEVLKSKLFQYLTSSSMADRYKEKWQEMLNNIPKKDYDSYVSDSYLFYMFLNHKDKCKVDGTISDNYLKFLDIINNKQKAAAVFNLMAEDEIENIYRVYSAIKTHNINSLVGTYFTAQMTTSVDNIHNLWKLYEEYKFEQSDIMFVSLFRNKEKLFLNHNRFIYSFMLYIFLFELVRSIIGTSPSNYSNSFKTMAMKLANEQDPSKIKKICKEYIKERKIDCDAIYKKLIQQDCFSKSYKTGKYIIMLSENIFDSKLTTEHFIPQKTSIVDDVKYVGMLGNLIPVIKDRYKDKSVQEKLEMYKEDSINNDLLCNFLKLGITEENYKHIIEERTKSIANRFVELIEKNYIFLTK